MTPKSVIDFWFDEANRPFWFDKSGEFDQTICSRFAGLWQQAARAELYEWRATLEGRLAEIIVLDQFSRNLFRNSPQAFACDAMAQVLAQEAAKQPGFAELPGNWRHMMLMPLMHSESRKIHALALELFTRHAAHALIHEEQHKAVIDRFGRYPHRNEAPGRTSSAEEIEFLNQEGSSF